MRRQPFRFDVNNGERDEMDEEEQEQLIHLLQRENEKSNRFFQKGFSILMGLISMLFALNRDWRSPIMAWWTSIASLFTTSLSNYPKWEVIHHPNVQRVNALLCISLAIYSIFDLYSRVQFLVPGGEGASLQELTRVCLIATLVVQKIMNVDVASLSRLRYNYKGA